MFTFLVSIGVFVNIVEEGELIELSISTMILARYLSQSYKLPSNQRAQKCFAIQVISLQAGCGVSHSIIRSFSSTRVIPSDQR